MATKEKAIAHRWLTNQARSSRSIWERALRAEDRAAGYHRLVAAAADLVLASFEGDGEAGVCRLHRDLCAADAECVLLAEVRRLLRGVQARLPGAPAVSPV